MNTARELRRHKSTSVLPLGLCVALAVFSVPAVARDTTLARSLAATCANCHGTDGRSRNPALPSLAGVKAETLMEALANYRSGRQPGTVMPQIVKGYTEEQLRLIAAYFAAQPKP